MKHHGDHAWWKKKLTMLLMDEWVPSSEAESLIIWVRQFLQGQDWVVLHHRVKSQVHNTQQIGHHVGVHLSWGRVLNQLGPYHRWSQDLIWVITFPGWNADDEWCWTALSGFFPPKGSCNLCNPGWREWGPVVRLWLKQALPPGVEW